MANAATLSKHLGGYFTLADINAEGPNGINLTITDSAVELVGQGRDAEEKPVLSFKESRKKLVLSKGRCESLTDLFGEDDLNGKQINLCTALERGKMVQSIRAPQ